ncbi:hypothetical protein BH11MYX3_BH11MYX3_44790 [soil metagenome]
MRALVAAVLNDQTIGEAPSRLLLQTGMLAPIAYRRGVTAAKADYAATMIVAERRRKVLEQVIRVFTADGIDIALIKGCAFVGTIYPDPAERPMNDMDVLIRKHQLPAAIEHMLALGFQRVGFDRKLSDFYHAVVFLRGDVMVELHRNIVQPYRTRMRIEDAWARSSVDPDGVGERRLDRVDELLICAMHVARHELAVPAINYVDVSRLWNRLTEAERTTMFARAAEWRIARAISAVLAMTENLAQGRTGSPVIGPGSQVLPTTDDVLRGAQPRRLRQIAQKLLLAQGTRERIGLGFTTIAAIVDGWRLARTFDADHPRT